MALDHSLALALPAPPLGPPTLEPERPVILIVDDDPDIVYLLGRLLRDAGFTPASATHSDEVLACALRLRPALVLLDVVMDGRDGIQLTQAIHAEPELASVPVLLISARTFIGPAVAAAGAQDGITKPFPIMTLLRKVRTLIKENTHGP